MGTRGTITIKDGKKTLVTIYKQYDSYLSHLGGLLKKFLEGREVVNGISGNMTLKTNFNGVGELAAYVIMELKKESSIKYKLVKNKKGKYVEKIESKNSLGDIYIIPKLGKNDLQEYNYTIYLKRNNIFLKCTDYDGSTIFDSNVNDIKDSDLCDK